MLPKEFANNIRTDRSALIASSVFLLTPCPAPRIFPEDIHGPTKLDPFVDALNNAFIGGGFDIPGIFRRTTEAWEFVEPVNGERYDLPKNGKTIITIGSVGQPRDGDPRAAYAILIGSSIVFHRVECDVEKTLEKIRNDPDTDDMHGDRLPHGR